MRSSLSPTASFAALRALSRALSKFLGDFSPFPGCARSPAGGESGLGELLKGLGGEGRDEKGRRDVESVGVVAGRAKHGEKPEGDARNERDDTHQPHGRRVALVGRQENRVSAVVIHRTWVSPDVPVVSRSSSSAPLSPHVFEFILKASLSETTASTVLEYDHAWLVSSSTAAPRWGRRRGSATKPLKPATTSLWRPLIDPERSIRNEMCTGASPSPASRGSGFGPHRDRRITAMLRPPPPRSRHAETPNT